ncbi:MAG: hypothetical protein ACYCPT_04060 [Acidimicrobiales bacterium]
MAASRVRAPVPQVAQGLQRLGRVEVVVRLEVVEDLAALSEK